MPGLPQPHSPEELWHLLQNPQSSAHGAQHLGDALVQSGVISPAEMAVMIFVKAAPMMTPTARSITLPRMANSRNSFIRLMSQSLFEKLMAINPKDSAQHGLSCPAIV